MCIELISCYLDEPSKQCISLVSFLGQSENIYMPYTFHIYISCIKYSHEEERVWKLKFNCILTPHDDFFPSDFLGLDKYCMITYNMLFQNWNAWQDMKWFKIQAATLSSALKGCFRGEKYYFKERKKIMIIFLNILLISV